MISNFNFAKPREPETLAQKIARGAALPPDAPKQPERIAKLQEQIEAACEKHGVIKVWEAFRRFRGNSDVNELSSLGIDPPFILDHKPIGDLHDRLPKAYKDQEKIVFCSSSSF